MDKELRKELHRDELGEALTEARSALTRSEVMKPALTVVALFLVLFGLYYGQRFRAANAESAFARATEAYHAPVGAAASVAPGAETFPTESAKLQKAKTLFDEVAKSYGSLPAGRRARYYSLLCLAGLGQIKEAEAGLKELAALKDPGALEPAMARLRIAELVLLDGRAREAADYYKKLIDDPAAGLPKDRLIFGLAESLEAAGQALEARRAYTDLVNRHPQSPYAEDARQKMEALATQS